MISLMFAHVLAPLDSSHHTQIHNFFSQTFVRGNKRYRFRVKEQSLNINKKSKFKVRLNFSKTHVVYNCVRVCVRACVNYSKFTLK